jgi:hypothetical protein
MYDKKIISMIETAVIEKTEDLAKQIVYKSERDFEQRHQLKVSLESLLERIERGLTVEIRFLPPPTRTDADGAAPAETAAFDSLSKIVPQLVFPRTAENPVLQLSHAEQKLAPETQDVTFNRSGPHENDLP